MRLTSQVIVSSDIENTISMIEESCTTERIVKIVEEEKAFSVDDAKEVIAKAYMASEETTVIVLAAKVFCCTVISKLQEV